MLEMAMQEMVVVECSRISEDSVEEEEMQTITVIAIQTKEDFNNFLDKAIDSDH